MAQKLSKRTLSVVASALIATNSIADFTIHYTDGHTQVVPSGFESQISAPFYTIIALITGGDNTCGVHLVDNGALVLGSTNMSGTFSGYIYGIGGITKEGFGTLTLNGPQWYDGATTINSGTLIVNGWLGVGVTTINGGTLILGDSGIGGSYAERSIIVNAGGTLQIDMDQFNKTVNGAGNIILNKNLSLWGAGLDAISGTISGTGSLTKYGNWEAILTLSGVNTYSGGTIINGGLINFTDGANLGTGNITLNGGGLQWAVGNTTDISARLNPIGYGAARLDTNGNDVTLASALSGIGGVIKEGTGTLTLSGTNTYAGDTTVNAGTLTLSGGSAIADTGSVIVNTGAILNVASAETVGSVSGAGNVTLGADLTTGANNTDDTLSGVLSGTGGLVKEGTVTLTLSGANTYTGATVINGGILAVIGDTSTSAFSVNSGGTLAGTGTVGSTTVASGGILAPTNLSTLTVAGNLTMNAGSTLAINAYANGTNSKVAATGTATINGGTVAVHSDSTGTWNTHTAYTILSAAGGLSGTFTGVTDDLAFLTPTLTYGANDVMLTLTRNSTAYASKGMNGYSAGVGAVLDNLTAPSSQMQTLLDVLNGTNDAGAAAMLAELSGAPLSSLAHMSSTQIRTFGMSLFSRMSGGGGNGGIGLGSLAFADNGDWSSTFRYLADAGAIGPSGFVEPQKLGDAQMWIRAVGGHTLTSGDVSRNLSKSTTTTGGLQMGADKRTGDWIVGGSLGYLRSNVDQSGMDGKVDSYQLGFYTAQDTKAYRLSFNAIGGKYNNSTSRTTPTGMANADFDGTALSAEINAAYKVPLAPAWSLEPSLGGWVQRYAQESYNESGATGSNLSVDKVTFTSQALTTELKLINTFGESKADKGRVEMAVGYNRESGDINAPLVGRFSAAPSAGSFSIASANRGQNVLTAMAGSDVTVAANTRLFALVSGNWRQNESGYSAVAGVKIGF